MDVHSYDEMQETMALLQILALGEKEIEDGKTCALNDVVKSMRTRQQRRGPTKSSALSAVTPRRRARS